MTFLAQCLPIRGIIEKLFIPLMRRDVIEDIHCIPNPPTFRALVVIDQEALYEALKEKWIKGAALDVFAIEPLPMSDPLIGLDTVILAPHAASASIEARTNMALLVAKNVEAFLHHQRPPTLVNREVLARNPL